MAEEALAGGITNAGAVTRDGAYVLRPANGSSSSVQAFLSHLDRQGFDGAPSPFGIQSDGRERLQFIPGDVPASPYPVWSQSDAALISIARLLRRFHDAGRNFDRRGHRWSSGLGDPVGGELICHNDIELSNVVFRGGLAVALIDFEYAAPGRAVYDVAQLIRLCAPIEDGIDQARMGWQPADRPGRARLVADAYGLDDNARTELITAIDDAVDRIEARARQQVVEGGAAAIAAMADIGGIAKYDRRRKWWQDHRAAFADALN